MAARIRPSLDEGADLGRIVSITAATGLGPARSVAQLQASDAVRRAGGLVAGHLLAEVSAEVIGFVSYGHHLQAARGDVFSARLGVLPQRWGRGVGRMLHEAMLEEADAHGVRMVFAYVDGRQERGRAFAAAAGYREVGRSWESSLDLDLCETTDSAAEPGGFTLRSVAEWMRSDPDWFQQLLALYSEIEEDVPFPIEEIPVTPAGFRATAIEAPDALLDGFLVAFDGGRPVGLTELRSESGQSGRLSQQLTGVIGSHRGRGLGRYLKGAAIRWAADNGYSRISTWNDATNLAMLSLNDQLGFSRSHVVHQFLLEFDT